MPSSDLSERQQRAAERILEDEGLTGDLTDGPARALVDWASAQASAVAGDASRSDEQVDTSVSALRRAVIAAARSGSEDGATLVAQAAAAYAAATTTPAAAAPATAPPVVQSAPPETESGPSAFLVKPISGLRQLLQRIGWRRRSHRRRPRRTRR